MGLNRVLVALVLGLSLLGAPAMAVEEPSFKTVASDGDFEIRDYPALVVAEVTVPGAQREAANAGFRLLAAYIFGGNSGKASIAMTAPVEQAPTKAPAGEKIAMTAPVTQTPSSGEWVVRFTMPSAYTLATLPKPNDPRVRLRETPPARFAVVKFSGVSRPELVATKTADLSAWMEKRQLRAAGPATLAQYNPPWTPGFMRRNEVMIPLAP
ncbi:MAG: heme-binding protein [Rhizobiales bacterium]|nr:heme-binding protein [Hyphomicrobiales bacterium]